MLAEIELPKDVFADLIINERHVTAIAKSSTGRIVFKKVQVTNANSRENVSNSLHKEMLESLKKLGYNYSGTCTIYTL